MDTPPSYLQDSSSSSSSSSSSESDSDSDYEFDPEPEPVPQIKRRKLSLPPTKLCIVCFNMASRPRGYDIVVADMDYLQNAASMAHDDEFIPIRTALRLKVGKDRSEFFLGFCGLGSKLYIFESTPHKSVYTIDLSSSSYCYSNDLTRPTVVFKKRKLRNKISDMLHPKRRPSAIPTPDGKKIMILSSLITFDPCTRNPVGDNDFELYDSNADTWQKLPGIRHDWWDYYLCNSLSNYIEIRTFTFIGTSTFFIETTTKLMFTLNLESIDQGWQRMDTFYGADSAFTNSRGRFLVMEDQLCVNPFMAYDISKLQRYPYGFTFPLPPFGDGIDYSGPPLVAVLGEDNANGGGKYNFCTLISGTSTKTRNPHLMLNLTSCDLSKYKKDKEKDKDFAELSRSMTVGDSIKFCLDGEQCRDAFPISFFSI